MSKSFLRTAAVALTSAALLPGAAGSASAAVSAWPALGSQQQVFLAQAVGRNFAGSIVPGDRITGYPQIPCTLANDGEEVQTLVTIFTPFPVATSMNWVCDGLGRTWKQR